MLRQTILCRAAQLAAAIAWLALVPQTTQARRGVTKPHSNSNRKAVAAESGHKARTHTPKTAQTPPTAPATGPNLSMWRFRFTPGQIYRLQRAGCRFDETDRRIANRLAARGFTEAHFVRAYEELFYLKAGDRKHLEALVVFRYLGFPSLKFLEFVNWGGTLTGYYNRQIGGLGQRIAGWVLVGMGLAGVAAGGIVMIIGKKTADQTIGGVDQALYLLGGVVMGAGAVMTGIGIPLVVTGTAKTNRWVTGSKLDYGHIRELERYRLHSGHGRQPSSHRYLLTPGRTSTVDTRLSLHPYIHRSGGGLGLVFTW